MFNLVVNIHGSNLLDHFGVSQIQTIFASLSEEWSKLLNTKESAEKLCTVVAHFMNCINSGLSR